MKERGSTYLMAPALAWLAALMVVPCGLILALAFFRRGIYGGLCLSSTVLTLIAGVRAFAYLS